MLGASPISSFQDNTDAARICANIYPGLKTAILSAHVWRFAMRKAELTLDNDAPLGEWEYSHVVPGDAISGGVHAVFTSENDDRPITAFEIFGRRIYSNRRRLWVDYKYNVSEDQFPEYFSQAMVYAVAADIALAITDQQSIVDGMNTKAYGNPSDNGFGGAMGHALSLQAQGQGNIGVRNDDFINERFSGNYLDDGWIGR